MLPGRICLGRIFGIEIARHFSWFIIAALLTMSLAGTIIGVVSRDQLLRLVAARAEMTM